ncbi:MAG: hypothetical protein VX498_14330, partial [Myxococcota bacterium]|nr:hypothetical protein [Myxococcota bacterium]
DPTWWLEGRNLGDYFELLGDLLRETVWLHVMPGFVLLLLPGLLLLPLSLRKQTGEVDGERGFQRLGVLLLLGAVLVQVPAVLLARTNYAFSSDWIFLCPALVVLALFGLERSLVSLGPRGPALARIFTLLVVAVGLTHALLPLLYSVGGADPIEEPEAYQAPLLRSFSHSATGRFLTTHHYVTTTAFPGDSVAATLAATRDAPTVPRVGLLDLSWNPRDDSDGACRLSDPTTPGTWTWGISDPEWTRPLSPWPFVFAGFDGVEWVVLEADGLSQDRPRHRVVRWWISDSAMQCRPREVIPDGAVEAAERFVQESLAVDVPARFLPDPTGRLAGWTVEWEAVSEYLRAGLLFELDPGARTGRGGS